MKKITSLLLFIIICFAANAQTDLVKKISDSTCACLSTMPNLEKKSQQEIEAAIGQCMMTKSMEDFMALAQERNIDMNDQAGMQKLGMEIGVELVKSNCKAMTGLMLKMASETNSNKNNDEILYDLKEVQGIVQNVEVKDFVYVTVLANAKITQLVWSDRVNNGNNYVNNLSSLKNKNVSFSYNEKEIYSIKDKAYIAVKMISSINPPQVKAQPLKN